MPREIVHWTIVESLQGQFPSCPALTMLFAEQLPALYLGSVAHDVPYYLDWGQSRLFNSLGDSLHGTFGEDTFDPIRDLASAIINYENPAHRQLLWAVTIGMVTHVITDAHFHPLVSYFTGDYYHPIVSEQRCIRRRHRLFEVYLDHWFLGKRKLANNGKLRQTFAEVGKRIDLVCELFGNVLSPDPAHHHRDRTGKWRKSFDDYVLLQTLFHSPSAGILARLLGLFSPKLASYEGLFSFRRTTKQPYFSTPLQYKNPVTGKVSLASVEELLKAAMSECREVIAHFEPLVSGAARDVSKTLGDLKGRSMDVGVYRAVSADAQYFSETFPPLPGM